MAAQRRSESIRRTHEVAIRAVAIADRLAGGDSQVFLRKFTALQPWMLRAAGLLTPNARRSGLHAMPACAVERVTQALRRLSEADPTHVDVDLFPSCVALGTRAHGTFKKSLTGVLVARRGTVLTASHDDVATHAAFGNDLRRPDRLIPLLQQRSLPAVTEASLGSVAVDAELMFLTQAGGDPAPLATRDEIDHASDGVVVKFGADGVKTSVRVALGPCHLPDCDSGIEVAAWTVTGTTDLCVGDSGAPLFINVAGRWKVLGVLSAPLQSGECASGALFSRVDRVAEWLRNNRAAITSRTRNTRKTRKTRKSRPYKVRA